MGRLATMSSPVPLLRPPVPGGNRSNSGIKTPRLTLGIPLSPSARPVTQDGQGPQEIPKLSLATGRTPGPKLSLATPAGSQTSAIPEHSTGLKLKTGSLTGSSDSNRSRADSFHKASVPGSAASSAYSGFSFVPNGQSGTPDPSSAISSVYSEAGIGGTSMEREGSMGGLSVDFDKMSLEKGGPIDVEVLDDDGCGAASDQKKIIELGSLGEGAGGAVTRCILDGAKTVFALKVSILHLTKLTLY